VKLTWEAARFGWVYPLGRAYYLSSDERYAQAFWQQAEDFFHANPPYRGAHWASAQEAGLRLLSLAFAGQVFRGSTHSTAERIAWLGRAIAAHARRIPPSTAYALAQNNNHVLSEAAALYTAGLALPGHSQAKRWRALGWKLFVGGLKSQIDSDGTYMQHSTNYHRLMLQLGLWVTAVGRSEGEGLPEEASSKLAAATVWLLDKLDQDTGRVPNLGPNDGAYILPLTSKPAHDYRPALQAAGLAFLGKRLFEPQDWDEMSLWLGQEPESAERKEYNPASEHSTVLRSPSGRSWAYLRTANFSSRPGHADQLHLDLWWRGTNLAQDAGTYLYNAAPPWDNSLARTGAHNTLMVNGQEQMRWVNRFLWLDWAQAWVVERSRDGSEERLVACHDGYRRLGVIHQRAVALQPGDHWVVEDCLLPIEAGSSSRKLLTARLHWLLPDWSWEVEKQENSATISLKSVHGLVRLAVSTKSDSEMSVQIVRAGERLYGGGEAAPNRGWASPTYNVKLPALSFSAEIVGQLPLYITSDWILPVGEA
jgi:hypothetical protein